MNKNKNKWWQNAVFYELYVDKFAGNFSNLADRLDYFEKLGVTCLHLLPHYPSPMVDDGYDISDYKNVKPELGTLDDFKKFIEEAHKRGIRVLADMILNHVSSMHPWFVDASSSKESPYRDYFLWSEKGEGYELGNNAFPHLKPKNWIWNEATQDYYYATFYAEQPDLNWNNQKVVDDMYSVMDFWIDIGVDAFRLDAISFLIKKEGTKCESLPETHEVLKKLRAHLNEKNPEVALLAEVVCDTLDTTMNYFGNGDECQLAYKFPMAPRMILAAKRNETTVEDISTKLPIPDTCHWAIFLRNHDDLVIQLTDEERGELLGSDGRLAQFKFRDELCLAARMATIFNGERKPIENAFKMLLSIEGTPIIYYGEEIGMENDLSQGEQRDTRRYVRGNFDWESAKQQMEDPNSLFSFVAHEISEKKKRDQLIAVEIPEEPKEAEAVAVA
ncbi:MAG: alpha-amylase family glycosyl hydrolase [Candidatus Paceibacterota bacterium]|jgi:maltose alpha-D-glucosyltransferase/alpha-amylase|nr:alpha-amylase family glycosyl hydrolase [Candidatus Paceibacterota bacterium]